MHGFLDELHQSFLTLDIGQGPLDFLVDTGFAGTLVVGEELFDLHDLVPVGAHWLSQLELSGWDWWSKIPRWLT